MLTPNEAQREPSAISNYLNGLGVNYMVIDPLVNHTLDEITTLVNLQKYSLLRTVLVLHESQILMCILPDDYFFDIGALAHFYETSLIALTHEEQALFLSKIQLETCPPLPDLVGINAFIDKDILSNNEIYFRASTDNTLIGMKRDVFMALAHSCKVVSMGFPYDSLAHKELSVGGISKSIQNLTPIRIKQRLNETIELPAIPAIAQKILKLRFNPHATSKELAQVLEKDPSLAAQLMSWATSPYYGYSGNLACLEDAIVKVLGFDLVMNLALGIILGRSMKVAVKGPMGLRAYWEFAILCAALAENLAKMITVSKRPTLGLVYLGGLLHNFGHLLLAQVFPPHFELLTQYVIVNPKANMIDIENYVLGISHDEIGAWMMQAWDLPSEVIMAISHHHDEEYNGEFAIYPNLVLVATRLLKRIGIGDAKGTHVPKALLEKLGLSDTNLEMALEEIISQREDLFDLVSQVVPK
ncbi:MAG: HDOD domain-containing protein [Candidatus Berkiella sp.]